MTPTSLPDGDKPESYYEQRNNAVRRILVERRQDIHPALHEQVLVELYRMYDLAYHDGQQASNILLTREMLEMDRRKSEVLLECLLKLGKEPTHE